MNLYFGDKTVTIYEVSIVSKQLKLLGKHSILSHMVKTAI